MRAKDSSLDFMITTQQFVIPFFQRPYVWKKSNWEELLNTLLRINDHHFLGMITFKPTPNIGKMNIIDGQQRLTTISILLKAILDSFDENTRANAFGTPLVSCLFYQDGIVDPRYCLKIEHSKFDSSQYKKVMGERQNNWMMTETDYNDIVVEEDDSRNENASPLILQCYKYFRESLSDFSNNELDAFYRRLSTEHMFVVTYLDKDENEQSIFDTINSSGVKLTTADIIKNYIFDELLHDDECREDAVVQIYNETWKYAFEENQEKVNYWYNERPVGRVTRVRLEMLLYSIAIIKGYYNPEEHDFNDLESVTKGYISNLNYIEKEAFLHEIKEYAEIYRDFFSDIDFDTKVFSYNDILGRVQLIINRNKSTSFNPFILYILKKYKNDNVMKNKRLTQLEKYLMKLAICSVSNKNSNKQCPLMIRKDQEESDGNSHAFDDYLNSLLITDNYSINDDSLRESLKKVHSNSLAISILFGVELYRRNPGEADQSSILYNPKFELEHIMPQSWQDYWPLSDPMLPEHYDGLTDESKAIIREEHIYSIGNMTLLSKKMNAEIQNYSFRTKMEGYTNARGRHVFGINELSSLFITQDIKAVYNQRLPWNEDCIKTRENSISEDVISIWGGPF